MVTVTVLNEVDVYVVLVMCVVQELKVRVVVANSVIVMRIVEVTVVLDVATVKVHVVVVNVVVPVKVTVVVAVIVRTAVRVVVTVEALRGRRKDSERALMRVMQTRATNRAVVANRRTFLKPFLNSSSAC